MRMSTFLFFNLLPLSEKRTSWVDIITFNVLYRFSKKLISMMKTAGCCVLLSFIRDVYEMRNHCKE